MDLKNRSNPCYQPPPSSETLVSSTASDYLNPKLAPSEFLKTLLLEKTLSGTDKKQSGGEEEETRVRGRKRRSRWDSPPSKRKSRWEDEEFDADIQSLNVRLLEITRMLHSGSPLDDRQEGQRSPSPEPIYDNNGVRINTREYRAKEKLNQERQEIISKIINKNPSFKPPSDYRPPKLQKNLYIPRNEFPGYSFIGLIIGPRGNTQKRMQKETGAKIVIRGEGSAKEGRHHQQKKYDPSEDEDLHVLVEAQTQESLDAAVGMVEKLLKPVDEVLNEHKRQQLRELATLNGTIRGEEFCRKCGEPGHRQYACPSSMNTFKSDVLCNICGDGGHPTIDCPVKGTTGKKMEDEYQNFLAELGGTGPESSLEQSTTTTKTGLRSSPTKPSKEYDETNLYIGFLPPRLDDDGLVNLFSPFGEIVTAKLIKDHVSGMSKCYGFVKYADVQMANSAVEAMNGYRLEGKTLSVRIAGQEPPSSAPQSPTQAYTAAQVHWGPFTSYSLYPSPPPPGSYHPMPGQHMSPYGMHYPPPPPPPHVTQALSPRNASQSPSSSDSFPPGVQADNAGPASSDPPNDYISSVTGLTGQLPYIRYPSFYSAVPPSVPASSTNHSQSMGNMTWTNSSPVLTYDYSQSLGNAPGAPNPPIGYSHSMGNAPWDSKPPVQPPAENSSAVGGSEYEKFMAELM